MSRAELKSLAKKQIKGNVLILFMICLIANVGNIVGSIGGFYQNYFSDGSKAISVDSLFHNQPFILSIVGILMWFVVCPLFVSYVRIYFNLAHGQKPEISMLGYGFKNCWIRSVLLNLFKGLLLAVWAVPAVFLGLFSVIALLFSTVWSSYYLNYINISFDVGAYWVSLVSIFLIAVFFFVMTVIKSYSYGMSEYVMAENPDIKPMDAIRESKKMMKGHKFELFVLDLSFIWWFLLAVITFGIACVYIAPYVMATRTNFYLKLKEAKAE